MTYRIELSNRARRELEQILAWVTDQAPIKGPQWFARLKKEIQTLQYFPERCPVASDVSRRGAIIRKLLFGKRSHRIRVYLEIRGDTVKIHHIRHRARERPTSL